MPYFALAKRRDYAEGRPMPNSGLSPLSEVEPTPRFVSGSISRHIAVMTGTSAIGLMAIFVSDFANIFFLGRLGDLQLLAAVGYASSIMFFLISAGVGMSIAVVALVAPALGAREFARARRLASHTAVFAGAAASLLVAALWPALPALLGSLGAEGRTLMLAQEFLTIVLPSWPPLVLGMCASAILRSGRRGATCHVDHADRSGSLPRSSTRFSFSVSDSGSGERRFPHSSPILPSLCWACGSSCAARDCWQGRIGRPSSTTRC
jgi:hypothetical protein